MKPKLTLLALLISIVALAQNGINYKAVIKDSNGNVIANDLIQVQFSILQGATQTNVYQETHIPTTDANGLIIVNIGEGTSSDVFSDIDWSSDDHFLNVQIDIGNGFVDLGTTQFMHVPYAIQAKNASNVTGLEAIDEGNGMGWRLIGSNPANYGSIGFQSTDLSYSNINSSTYGATGPNAITMGIRTSANGDSSLALGSDSTASEDFSIAIGAGAEATEQAAISIGGSTIASGFASTAMGSFTQATGEYATAMGRNTTAIGNSSFAVGDGNLASGDYSFVSGMSNQVSIISEAAFAFGLSNYVDGQRSGAFGYNNSIESYASYAFGDDNEIENQYSAAFGHENTVSSAYSAAFGSNNFTSGSYSASFGYSNQSLGSRSFTFGNNITAYSLNEFVIGQYNTSYNPVNSSIWTNSNRLFVVANGVNLGGGIIIRNNALTILKNGNVGIGFDSPDEALHIDGRLKIGTETIEDGGNNNLRFNASLLPDNDNVMTIGSSNLRWTRVWATDGTINTSDRRAKTNITNLNYGLNDILMLNPVSFNWKTNPNDDTKLGLIAQDVLKVIPEVVKTHDWETDEDGNKVKKELERMGVYYSDLVPVLIKAIQEQQSLIDSQKAELNNLSAKLENIKDLDTRVKQLEALLKTIEH